MSKAFGSMRKLSEEDHRDLIDIIIDMDGMVVLSGYDNELYDELHGIVTGKQIS